MTGAKVVAILGKVIKSAIIEKASIDEVYLDVTEEATRRLNAIQDDVPAFNELIAMARASALAGEDAVEMKMSKNALRKGHSGTKKDDESELEGPNVRDWLEQPHYVWNHDDKLLLCGAIICDELRSEVLKQINYSCSGGVAHNKMLSKIASAMHKPNRQTLVPLCAVQNLMHCLPINRVAGFGGKLGDSLSDFGGRKLEKFSDLIEVGKSELSASFGEETTIWMLNAAAGIDHTPVEQRALTASIGCGKSYRQKNTLPPIALQDGRVLHWLRELSEELEERVQVDTDMHSRKPKQITVGLSIAYVIPPKPAGEAADPVKRWHEGQGMSLSKVGPMCAGAVAISKAAHAMAVRAVADSTRLNKPWNITYISLSASGFVPIANESRSISSFFKSAPSPIKKSNPSSPYDKNTAMLLKEKKEKKEQNEGEDEEIQLEIEKKRLSTLISTPSSSSSSNSSSSSSSSSPSDIAALALFPSEHSSHSIDRNSGNIEPDLHTLKTVYSAAETAIESDIGISTQVPHEVKNIPQDFYCGNDNDCEEYENDGISDSIKEISSYYTDKHIINKKKIKNTKNVNSDSDSVDDENNDVDKSVKKVFDGTNNHIDDAIRSGNYHNQIDVNNNNNKNKNEIKNSKILQEKLTGEISEKTTGRLLSESSKVSSSILTDDESKRQDDLSRDRTVQSNGISSSSFHNDLLEENKHGVERDEIDGDGNDDVIIMEDNNGEMSHEYNDLYDYNDHNNDSNDSNSNYVNIDNNARQIIGSNDDVIDNSDYNHNDNNDTINETDNINDKDNDNNNNDNDNDNSHDNPNSSNTKNNNKNHNTHESDNNIDNNYSNNNNNNSLNNSTTVSQIDMEVFYSLPLDLQKELSASMNIPNFSNFQDSKDMNKVSVPKGTKNKVNYNSKKNFSVANIPKTGTQLPSYFSNSFSNSSKFNSDDSSNVIMIEDDDSGNENENEDADNNNNDIDILSTSKR